MRRIGLAKLGFALAIWGIGTAGFAGADIFPGHEWETTTDVNAPADPATKKALDAFYASAFAREVRPEDPSVLRTDAVLIVKAGKIIAERYYKGKTVDESYDAHAKHITWSVSKSIVNALLGVAVREGRLGLNTPVSAFYPQLRRPESDTLAVGHALQFGTCLDWTESYEGNDLRVSSVIAMLYGPGHADMASYVAKLPQVCPPGTRWRYSSGDPLLTTGVLKSLYGEESLEYPWSHLFDKLGMTETTFETDPSGTFIGSSSVYTTARDLARVGLLYARDGMWNGEKILPDGWTKMSASVAPAFEFTAVKNPKTDAIGGFSFWPNTDYPKKGMPLRFPDVPRGAYLASGHWGQMVAIIPSKDIVVVRLGDDRDARFGRGDIQNSFLKLALAAAGEK